MSVDSLSATLALPCEPRKLLDRSYRLQRLGNTVTYQRSMEAIARMRAAAVGQLCAPRYSMDAASGDAASATALEVLASPAAIIAASWAAGQSQTTAGESNGESWSAAYHS